MREVFAERLSVSREEARLRLAGLLEISPVEAGLQTAAWLCGGIGAERAAVAAAKRNVDVTPLNRYGQGTLAREGLQPGFAALDVREKSAVALENLLEHWPQCEVPALWRAAEHSCSRVS